MKAVMVMFDTLSRRYLSTYGNDWVQTVSYTHLEQKKYWKNMICLPRRIMGRTF